MLTGLLGRKRGMTQLFSQVGELIAVSVLEVGPCTVIQKKTKERDGYEGVVLGFLNAKRKHTPKPLQGRFDRLNIEPCRHVRELRLERSEGVTAGQVVDVGIFNTGDRVDIVGTSKGKGFAGVVKRHHFAGAPASHGTHEYFRHPGSIGASAFPSHVFKGKRMPGHMGHVRVTAKNLQVVLVDRDKNLLGVKGAVPGCRGGLLIIRKRSAK